MPQTFESKSPVVPNIQDAFLNLARRDRLSVRIRLMDGTEFEARIKNFDRFAIIVVATVVILRPIATFDVERKAGLVRRLTSLPTEIDPPDRRRVSVAQRDDRRTVDFHGGMLVTPIGEPHT